MIHVIQRAAMVVLIDHGPQPDHLDTLVRASNACPQFRDGAIADLVESTREARKHLVYILLDSSHIDIRA